MAVITMFVKMHLLLSEGIRTSDELSNVKNKIFAILILKTKEHVMSNYTLYTLNVSVKQYVRHTQKYCSLNKLI